MVEGGWSRVRARPSQPDVQLVLFQESDHQPGDEEKDHESAGDPCDGSVLGNELVHECLDGMMDGVRGERIGARGSGTSGIASPPTSQTTMNSAYSAMPNPVANSMNDCDGIRLSIIQ